MKELIPKAEAFVRAHVSLRFPPTLRYHTLPHMEEVADAARKLSKKADLEPSASLALQLAAWFHDTGYHQGAEGHEQRSLEIASEFLRGEGADEVLIGEVGRLILATQEGMAARDPLEELIKDADMMHCARTDYPEIMELLREELENTQGKKVKKKAWLMENIAFMESHPFLSGSARNLWDEGRMANIAALKRALEEREAKKAKGDEVTDVMVAPVEPVVESKEEKKAQKDKQKELDKGVETMFKITLGNHTRLSAIADRKANMMLSVSSLIISVVIARLLTRFDGDADLLVPAGILALTCAGTIITATLATRPKVSQGTTTRSDIQQRKANLLFFGNFHNMSLPDFQWGMNEVMTNKDYLYSSMVKDLYFLGKVLHKKYVYLNLTYSIFAGGVLLAIIAGVAMVLKAA